jgi:phosphatidylglycerophosphate synthase
MLATESRKDRKHSDSLLAPWERRVVGRLLRHVPAWVESQHLTLLTLLWSALVLSASALARGDERWLWALSGLIALQYVTDAIDGKVGTLRNAGLVRWGYYMDHLLDYVFLCAILLGYTMLLPDRSQYLMAVVLAVSGGFMVSSFLARSVTGVLTISYLTIGPIEIRLVFMAINVWLATAGRAYMVGVVPYVIGASLVTLCALVFETQRTLWNLDRAEPRATEASQHRRSYPGLFPVVHLDHLHYEGRVQVRGVEMPRTRSR